MLDVSQLDANAAPARERNVLARARDLPRAVWRTVRLFRDIQDAPPERRARAERLNALCRSLCTIHGFDLQVMGELPRVPSVLVSNHLGYIDPVALCATLPLSPIAKFELQSWPGIGGVLHKSNVIFVRRKDPYGGAIALRRALRALEAGISVLNFPEGTTTRGRLLPFHRGAFWLARRTGVPLVPVAIRLSDPALCWVDDEAFVPHYAKLWCRRDRRLKLVFAPALDPRSFADEHELSAVARQAIAHSYARAAFTR